jgi:hypothetical protein
MIVPKDFDAASGLAARYIYGWFVALSNLHPLEESN